MKAWKTQFSNGSPVYSSSKYIKLTLRDYCEGNIILKMNSHLPSITSLASLFFFFFLIIISVSLDPAPECFHAYVKSNGEDTDWTYVCELKHGDVDFWKILASCSNTTYATACF